MKGFLFFILLACSKNCVAQSIDSLTDNFKYDTVIVVKGNQNELFTKSKIWFTSSFKSAKDVLQTEDKNEGFIIGKGNLVYQYDLYTVKKKEIKKFDETWTNRLYFTIKIYSKNDKARVIIEDIIIGGAAGIESLNRPLTYLYYKSVPTLLASENLKDKASGMTAQGELAGIESALRSMIGSLIKSLNSKSETDF
jgi:hypothetical protein